MEQDPIAAAEARGRQWAIDALRNGDLVARWFPIMLEQSLEASRLGQKPWPPQGGWPSHREYADYLELLISQEEDGGTPSTDDRQPGATEARDEGHRG